MPGGVGYVPASFLIRTTLTEGTYSYNVYKDDVKIASNLTKTSYDDTNGSSSSRYQVAAVVKGALCHDLGILGRYEKYKSNKECSRRHPADSVEIARKLVEDLPEKSADIIERHMWPAGHSKAPNSLECVIVSVADKYAAIKDLVQGSEIKHTGIKNKVHDLFREDNSSD